MFSLGNESSSLSFIDLDNVQQVKRNLNEMLFNCQVYCQILIIKLQIKPFVVIKNHYTCYNKKK